MHPVSGNGQAVRSKVLAVDTETTGLDFWHGAHPYLVTVCGEDLKPLFWEWPVDPLTREVQVDPRELQEIKDELDRAPRHVFHNAKFDVHALHFLGIEDWPWDRTWDTLVAAHLLGSNQKKNLTDLAIVYLGTDIEPLEDALEAGVQKARRMVQQARVRRKRSRKVAVDLFGNPIFGDEVEDLANWKIAEKGLADMPSVKEKSWKQDGWLLRAMRLRGLAEDHPEWDTLLSDYANEDSRTTRRLWDVFEEEIKRKSLWEIYRETLKTLPIASGMERRGVTLSGERHERTRREYARRSVDAAQECEAIARDLGYDLSLPRSGNNRSLLTFCFDVLNLPRLKESEKTGEPSLDKEVLEHCEASLPRNSAGFKFVEALRKKRSLDTAISYLDGYEKFWLPASSPGWFILHSNLNVTGTDTLRWSSTNPNEQNISKKEGFNLRSTFGPRPGRELWALDAQNIERRIPAYEADETDIIALFERPDDPPYFGSEHALVAHVLYPREFEGCRSDVGVDGRVFKKKFASTLYDRVKRGNFSVQNGAQRAKADATYGLAGAFDTIRGRFVKQEALNQKCITFANKFGWIETIPDRTVNPRRGYPLLCQRGRDGRVTPTIPFSYRVQGSAMWWMRKAMVKCQILLDKWAEAGFDGFITLQVHDELVFDFPRRERAGNLWRAKALAAAMASCGADFVTPIKTPVSISYHPTSYADEESIE